MSRFLRAAVGRLAAIHLAFIFMFIPLCVAQQTDPAPAPMANRVPPTISLSPAVVMARGTFGQGLSQSLTLTNQTSHDFAFEMVANDVVVKNGKRAFVEAGQLPKSIAATAVFSRRAGVVKANSSVTVDVRVTVPEGTDIRAVVAIFRGTNNIADKSSVGMTASLGALITFNLSDHTSLEAAALKISPPTATSGLRVSESIQNNGSEPVLPEGVAAFLDSGGKLSAKLPFLPQRLLPGEKLDFTADYGADLRPGDYRVLCSFEYEGKTLTTQGTYDAK
jgi:hypothetical protein